MGASRFAGNSRAGAAVLATNNPVYRLAVEDGYNGLLVEQTPESWHQALTRIVTDHELRQRIQLAAYKTAWKRFDISRHVMDWARAYNSIAMARPKLKAI
jgi:glycosyltransferase involved in cell wall biosynthesis